MGDAPGHDGPYSQSYSYDERGNLTQRQGWGGWNASSSYPFDAKNRNLLLSYDTAGNVTGDGSQLSYDATGQQVRARYPAPGGWDIAQGYDGDRQRVKKVEGGQTTVYLRSTVLGGQVVGEYNQSGVWLRGYVYDGGAQLLAMQAGGVQWVHQDPVTKSQRVTDRWGNFISAIDVDPWGGETSRMENGSTLSRKFTTYERDGNGRDQAMQRSYHAWFSRFDQPDPYDGSYDLANPQSFNRYAYVGNDPVNFVDPTGLEEDEVVRVYTWAPTWNWREQSGGRSGGGIRPRLYRLESPRGTPQQSEPPDFVREFYDQYQKKLARCIWSVFSRTANGDSANTAQIMTRQTLRNAPQTDQSATMRQIGARNGIEAGFGDTDAERGRFGTIFIGSDLERDPAYPTLGRNLYHRTYAHELGNVLSKRYTGSAFTFGAKGGIVGTGGSGPDYDTGAKLEDCIFGDVSP